MSINKYTKEWNRNENKMGMGMGMRIRMEKTFARKNLKYNLV